MGYCGYSRQRSPYMPTTNDNRSIVIIAKPLPVTASSFAVDFASSFSTELTATLNFTDKSDGFYDRTFHEVVFSEPATGEVVGRTWIKLRIKTKVLKDFEAKIDIEARGTSEPPAAGSATTIREPQAADFRRWAQVVKKDGVRCLRNVALVDVRSVGEGVSVSQTIRTDDAGSLLIAIEFSNAKGSVASGTLNLTTAATPGEGYELGPVRITHRENDGRAERSVHRG